MPTAGSSDFAVLVPRAHGRPLNAVPDLKKPALRRACLRQRSVALQKEELKSLRDDYAYWLDIVKLEDKAYGNQKLLARYRVLANSTTGNKKKLIKKQYRFYRDYLKLGVFKSTVNLIRWGLMGLKKYKGI